MAVKSDEFMSGKGSQLLASEEMEEGMQLSIKKRWWKVQLAAAASIKYYGKETFIILRGLQGKEGQRLQHLLGQLKRTSLRAIWCSR